MMSFVEATAEAVPLAVAPSLEPVGIQVYLALIGLAATFLTITMPVIMAWLINRNAAKVKIAEYARQDQLRDEEHARQDLIAQRTTEAAERAERVARENASLLLMANAQIVASSLRNGEKLDVLTVQGDGQMTALFQSELNITRVALKSLMSGVEKDRVAGVEPDTDTLAEIKMTEKRIIELKEAIEERLKRDRVTKAMPSGKPD